ncbi:MAG: carboxypeptidase-like regulatory domain-containing protein, partial [Crocinitomicaceae bacterium]|nr:carboxypeptidase-like regulatory domain-containing protein [Crocinitomicaceae bacterium]
MIFPKEISSLVAHKKSSTANAYGKILLPFVFFLFSVASMAQVQVTGIVTDATTGETLIGASVVYAEGKGTVTDIDGKFSLLLEKGSYVMKVSYVGMEPQEKPVVVEAVPLYLEFQLFSTSMNEVEIIGDIAIDRKTPVAYSDISPMKIKEELGTRDLPLVLNSTPGIYATQSGGGDGDSRVNIRGFNGRYVAVMVDGIPMNDMENGLVYWSNWFGLDVVTQKVQIQRGLGASKLAIPSIGGTINILSQGIEQKRSIVFSSEYGNNQNLRETIGYNSGKLKGGWGVTASLSVKKNNGWVENLRSKQLFYFLKIQKDFDLHSLSISILGSPQEHFQRPLRQPVYYYDKTYAAEIGIDTDLYSGGDYGWKHNPYWGKLVRNRGGENPPEELLSDRVNYYHKPIVNLKHFWSLGERLALSNIAYCSFGNGGGTALQNSMFDANGQTDFEQIYYNNTHGSIFVPPYDLAYVNDTSKYKARNFIFTRINNHFWAGVLSTFKFKANKRFEFSGGVDGRYYYTDRYQAIYDLLGGDYAVPSAQGDDKNNPSDLVKRVGDVFGYKIRTYVKQGGIFLLGEYTKDQWSSFINVTGSINSYNRTDYFELKGSDGKYPTSGWKTFPGGTVKGGINYNINKYHSVFVNAGYLSRAQMAANVFVSSGLRMYSGLKNELIIAEEVGYVFKRGILRTAVNAYYTVWKNKPVKQTIAYGTEVYPVSIPGMNALHKGIEVEAELKTSEKLSIE